MNRVTFYPVWVTQVIVSMGPDTKEMKSPQIFFLLTILLLLFPVTPPACCFTPAEIADINRSVELTINHEYLQAITVFSNRLEDSGQNMTAADEAVAHFHIATVYASWMQDREDFAKLESYQFHLERCEQLTDSLLLEVENPDLRFIRAGCSLYHSYLAKRQGQWWRMYRQGMDGVNRLEKLAEDYPDYREVDLGLGNYYYWKSSLLQHFAWVPFVRDHRSRGIAQLERAAAEGRFGSWLAVSNLTWILMDYGQTEQALQLALKGRERFPDSRHFLFPLAKAELQSGQLTIADSLYTLLLQQVTKDQQPSRYNEFYCLEKLVNIKLERGMREQALFCCDRALALPLSPSVQKRVEENLEELLLLSAQRERERP
jgi:hypothetical protein